MVFPGLGYKEKAIDYIAEFYTYGSEISGSGSLDRFLRESTCERWLEQLVKNMDIANLPETMVPSLTYFYVREEDDKIVGMINIRLALNEFLRKEAGNIGYSVRPTERRKHYRSFRTAAESLMRNFTARLFGRPCKGMLLNGKMRIPHQP